MTLNIKSTDSATCVYFPYIAQLVPYPVPYFLDVVHSTGKHLGLVNEIQIINNSFLSTTLVISIN